MHMFLSSLKTLPIPLIFQLFFFVISLIVKINKKLYYSLLCYALNVLNKKSEINFPLILFILWQLHELE